MTKNKKAKKVPLFGGTKKRKPKMFAYFCKADRVKVKHITGVRGNDV